MFLVFVVCFGSERPKVSVLLPGSEFSRLAALWSGVDITFGCRDVEFCSGCIELCVVLDLCVVLTLLQVTAFQVKILLYFV